MMAHPARWILVAMGCGVAGGIVLHGAASGAVLQAVLPAFGLPEGGLLLVLGIDHVLDMGRTATSVLGNAVATAVVGQVVARGADRDAAAAQAIQQH